MTSEGFFHVAYNYDYLINDCEIRPVLTVGIALPTYFVTYTTTDYTITILTCHASVGLEITPEGWRAELLRFVALRAVADFVLVSEPADNGR